jgi:L-malate glycosyltransferase
MYMLMKKVLIIAYSYPNKYMPGDANFVEQQAKIISSRHDVCVISLVRVSCSEQYKYWLNQLPKLPELEVDSDNDRLRVYRQYVVRCIPYDRLFFQWYLKTFDRVVQQVFNDWGKPDIIHAHNNWPAGLVGSRLSKTYSIPMLVTEHSTSFDQLMIKNHWFRKEVEQASNDYHKIITVSPYLAECLKSFLDPENIIVVGNVILTDFFSFSSIESHQDKNCFQFLSICNLYKHKGIAVLISACKILLDKKINNFRLLIVGDGSEMNNLKQQVKNERLDQNIHFLGYLDSYGVREQIQACDCLVHPSFKETFGIVVAEAMACGKPVIATRNGGSDFIIQTPSDGILINAGDAQELANAMYRVAVGNFNFNPVQVRNSIINRFGEKVFIDRLDDLYNSLHSY